MATRRNRAGYKINRARRGAEDTGASDRRSDERKQEAEQSADRPLSREKARKRVMAAALKSLAARPRSERQLRDRLLEKTWVDEAVVDECIERLKELKLIDDGLFAHNYASHRVSAKPMGRSRLARELVEKKVPREEIHEALDIVFGEMEEEALIDRAIEKRIRTHGRPADRRGEKRMFDHLARLGFEYDLILRRLRALRSVDEED